MVDFENVKYHVGCVLRDHPGLRGVGSREKVWLLVKTKLPTAKFSTVERVIRKFQNDLGMYLPDVCDNRFEVENEYREYFGRDKRNVV